MKKRITAFLLTLAVLFMVMIPETAYAKTKYVYKVVKETVYGSDDPSHGDK